MNVGEDSFKSVNLFTEPFNFAVSSYILLEKNKESVLEGSKGEEIYEVMLKFT